MLIDRLRPGWSVTLGGSWGCSVPATGDRRVDAIGRRSEPGLHAENRRQVVSLLGRVERGDLRAWGHGLGKCGAGVGEQHGSVGTNRVRNARLACLVFDGARRENPQLTVRTHLLAVE